jgi:crotonobetainyl-CoA:carnitine CoA-transferase CaiB-like acyl-CoA transferase
VSGGPLEGIRVVEAAAFVAGPYSAMMLADMGADVVKVEPPTGDPLRTFGRRVAGLSITFVNTNRNKSALTCDLRTDAGKAAFLELLEDADILVTNWRPGVAEGFGLDADFVRERFPKLVWVRITGYGLDGPLASTPVFDALIQARSGMMVAQGENAPRPVWSWIVDKVTASFAAQASLAGLVRRNTTGDGSIVDISLLDSFAYFNFPDLLTERTILSEHDRPALNAQNRGVRPVPTKDGWLMVNPVRGIQLKRALEAFGRADSIAELKTLNNSAATHRFFVIAEEAAAARTTAEWLEILAEHDVPAAPVLDFDAHFADPQVVHNRTYVEMSDPRLGPIRQPRFPARFNTGEAGIMPAPDLDRPRAESNERRHPDSMAMVKEERPKERP